CGRSVETARRSQLAEACGYGYSRSHSRWFFGVRLHLACAPDGTPRAAALAPADRPEREIALPLLARSLRGGETIVCDKGYAGREFAAAVAALGGSILRPARRDEQQQQRPHLAPIRQRIESIFASCKDVLTLERHGARTEWMTGSPPISSAVAFAVPDGASSFVSWCSSTISACGR